MLEIAGLVETTVLSASHSSTIGISCPKRSPKYQPNNMLCDTQVVLVGHSQAQKCFRLTINPSTKSILNLKKKNLFKRISTD